MERDYQFTGMLRSNSGDIVEVARARTNTAMFYIKITDPSGGVFSPIKPVDKPVLIKFLDKRYEPRKFPDGRAFMERLEKCH